MTKTEFKTVIKLLDANSHIVKTYSSKELWANLAYKRKQVRITPETTFNAAVNIICTTLKK